MKKVNLANDPRFKQVYQDKKGNKWFTYVNPTDIDAVRGIAAERAERFRAMMITEEELKLALDSAVSKAKQNEIVDVYAIIFDLRHRLNFISEENSILDLAGIYFLLQDEDPNMIMDSFKLKKQQIWQDDIECRGFFLRTGISLIEKLQSIPEADLLGFMEKTAQTAERLYRYIQKPSER